MSQVAKHIGELWAKAKPADKAKYEKMAETDKIRAAKDKAAAEKKK